MKKLLIALLCAAALASLCVFPAFADEKGAPAAVLTAASPALPGSAPDGRGTPGVSLPNPMVSYGSLKELKSAAGFSFSVPAAPNGYEAGGYYLIGGSVAQVDYTSGDKKITFRASLSGEDISGDYNQYQYVRSHEVDGTAVTAKRNGLPINLAFFARGKTHYTISSASGFSIRTLDQMVRDVLG